MGAIPVEPELHIVRPADQGKVIGKLEAVVVLLDGKERNPSEKAAATDLHLRAHLRIEIERFAVVDAGPVFIRVLPAQFIEHGG